MAAHGTDAWGALKEQVEQLAHVHLREMLEDSDRNASLVSSYNGIVMDYSRQRITNETMDLLMNLANVMKLKEKIDRMGRGEKINSTEGRAVLHVALRAPSDKEIYVDGKNVIPDVHEVLGRIKSFSESVRSGELKGASGKKLVNVVSIGIGGSYLGPEFVYEALRTEPSAKAAASGRMLRFLANVDPVDVSRALEGLNPEETLVIIISKTFTTAETMLNARTVRDWLLKNSKGSSSNTVVAKQMIAVSANVPKAQEFGIKEENVFGFWDWVGGRYSAVGMVPLSLQYGFDIMEQFLAGAHDIDNHFFETPLRENLPVILGVLGIWNSSFLGYPARALLPYSQALLRFPAHIQQVDMESNGKRVTINGDVLPIDVGEIDFGEPGTNGQHSFYQLIHQGRVIPADFIGFCESQSPVELNNEEVSNHDELMSNFFAQADALANGRTAEELEEIPEELRSHKSFPGNRPSTSILFPRLDAFTCGQLLSLFEHRTAVQGFIWDVNSFDQWGVELGKSLAKKVRQGLSEARKKGKAVNGFNSSTTFLMRHYLSHRS